MSKLTPPSKKNLQRRLKFFLNNPTFAGANWEVFDLSNQIINRDYLNRQINQVEYTRRMDELDRTQGWPARKIPMVMRPGEDNEEVMMDLMRKMQGG